MFIGLCQTNTMRLDSRRDARRPAARACIRSPSNGSGAQPIPPLTGPCGRPEKPALL